MNWLVKEEPSSYSFESLVRDGATRWSGVRNPLAQRHLAAFRKGDRVFYYHSGTQRAIIGIARATGDPRVDPDDPRGRAVIVDLAPVGRLRRAVPLAEIKALKAFAGHPLVRIPRLSVMPIDDRQWAAVEKAAAAAPPASATAAKRPTGSRRRR
jgi:predicted RNA-binding protein with PUA-like domain